MAAQYTLGFEQLTDSTIRVRVYDSPNQGETFIFQWIIPVADWNSILAIIGTGTGGAQTPGAPSAETFIANYGKQAGQVGVLEGAV